MYVEDLFKFIDRILGLDKISNIAVLTTSFSIIFFLTLLTLYKIKYEHPNYMKQNIFLHKYSMISISAIYLLIVILMIAGMSFSIYLYTIDLLLILGLVAYISILVITIILTFTSSEISSRFSFIFLFVLSTFLYAFFFSSKVLLNGVEASETTVDTLQIYYEGRWVFSRHAGWYDLAPVDAIVKVFLLYVLGINNPYDATLTTLMYSALSFSVMIILFGFAKDLFGNSIKGWGIAILLMSINPYALLIGMSTPPTNFSLVFSTLAILLMSRSIYINAYANYAILIGFMIFTISAILAHPMAIMIPAYLMAVSLAVLIYNSVKTKVNNLIYLSSIISIILFLIKLVFTEVSLGAKTLIDILLKGLMTLLSIEKSIDVIAYEGSLNPPPKSTLFSFAGFIGFISALFIIELIGIMKKKEGDKTSVFVLGTGLLLISAGVITNLVTSYSRYLAVPGIVLSSFQSIIYLSNIIKDSSRSKWRNILIILLGIMCLASTLSPNAMIEQYNVFTGGRWPRIENFILSSYLIYSVDPGYVINVFYGREKAMLNLYFTPDISYYGYPYSHINVLLTGRFLIPGVINAKSYWDFSGGRLFVKFAGYIDYGEIINEGIVFNGWKLIMTWE